MPNVEIDGTNSTVKTNVLTSQSGTTITVPTGKVLTVTDAAGLTVNGVAPLTSIANDAVTTVKILDANVTTAKIVNDAVTTAKIINNAVDETKFKDALVADFTEVVVTAADSLLLGDATDSGNTKRDTVQGILDLAVHTGNVAFPATQVASADANTLDDYEEGSWTATLSDSNSNAGMSTTVGVYTKIGRMVYCEIQMRNNNLTGISGTVRITGLPFTSANDGVYPALSCGHMNSAALTAATGYIHGFINPNTSYIELRINDETDGGSGLLGTEWDTDGQFFGSIFYHA